MSDQTSQTQPRRTWMRLLLIGSLTLNLLVIGLVVGAQVAQHRGHDFDPRGPDRSAIKDLGFGPMAKALDRKDRREIGRAFRLEAGSFKDNQAAMERDFIALLEVLRSDTFDAGAFEAGLAEQAARFQQRGDTLRRLLVKRIAEMSPYERKEFADRLELAVERGPKDKHR